MDKQEAKTLLGQELKKWRQRPYADLVPFVGSEPVTGEVLGGRGDRYQFEIQVVWDRGSRGDIRVLGAIDDSGIRAFVPLTDDFIIAPDGSFVGEDSV
jgi:hypothetical protein